MLLQIGLIGFVVSRSEPLCVPALLVSHSSGGFGASGCRWCRGFSLLVNRFGIAPSCSVLFVLLLVVFPKFGRAVAWMPSNVDSWEEGVFVATFCYFSPCSSQVGFSWKHARLCRPL